MGNTALLMMIFSIFQQEIMAQKTPPTNIHILITSFHYNKLCKGPASSASRSIVSSKISCACMCSLEDECRYFFYQPKSGLCQPGERRDERHQETNGEVLYNRIKKGNSEEECPGNIGYHRYQKNGPCIKFYSSLKTWFDAKNICESDSPRSHLAILDNEKKNLQVTEVGQRMNRCFRNGIWIGLYEDRQSSVYMWIDGSELSYDYRNGTDYSFGELGCVFLFRRSGWTWANTKCSISMHFVCELA